ncbi:phosphoribosyl-AMP cyclohydrolase [Hyphomicrobium nitrativorans NL23]|uniref:Phosphoribosyl-AMP cyclohydrolase n=1 Tax=Hyphomicrobium nitrativorans NL23 TaxID=1029756 RepID=V5SEQ0_9HYPH|nr:phosphoribosyl-AMP cyclohydrolase [Hyphomicrobium nitrativorans]AHB49003.1 phosphoribosyl-AMP cyclohydrolase [Hyphomicrobium nitrativorans NL23]
MIDTSPSPPARNAAKAEVEQGARFLPKLDSDGLIGAVVTDYDTGTVLMFAWMNETALKLTFETGIVHFWSRSRARLWKKGEESGNTLHLREARVDCDQDMLWIRADVAGAGVACHTGAHSCFYRTISTDADGTLVLTRDEI